MNIKREFIIVFHPYVKPGGVRPYRYKVISVNKLPDYIGDKWADYLLVKLLQMVDGKQIFKIRHKGTVYAYRR